MKYIIDGYNLIHQVPELKGKRLRSQREWLIRRLESAQAQNKQFKELTVVFDGPSQVVAPQIHSPVRVIFSRGADADKKIKQMIESSTFARDITVVSDDREVRFYISSVGAKKSSVREFLNKVNQPSKQKSSFKLNHQAAQEINQELAQIWLKKG
ncbi:NYN domain-containing protein [Candidatus Omnitrophota bacterium]